MRFLFSLFTLLFFALLVNAKGVKKNVIPSSWITKIVLNSNGNDSPEGDADYLLNDYQVNIPQQEVYSHMAVKVLTPDGIQSLSDISFDYDPSYQNLTIHQITVRRDGKVIDKLKHANINNLQRERNMERSLYDGTLTAVVNLSDIRENDIIEYAYTLYNFNPIDKGGYSDYLSQEYSVPVGRLYYKVVTDSSHPIKLKLSNHAQKPEVKKNGSKTAFIWDLHGPKMDYFENNVPGWYDPTKHVSFTTFKNWEGVVNWAIPLYRCDTLQMEDFDTNFSINKGSVDRITAIINWVQDEVRYLGFESGIGAYKPNKPSLVAQNRYGDCKDKSLLLVALLKGEGIPAYPLLVNTYNVKHVKGKLPSNVAFNHCVVQFEVEGETYYVDPTINDQGGDYKTRQFPYYERGLLIKPGETELTDIPFNGIGKTRVKEVFTIPDGPGDARLFVRTTYYGSRADQIRNYFASFSRENITNDYLTFYSSLYPEIYSTSEVNLLDYKRNSTNELIIEEYYSIPNLWVRDELSSNWMATFEPLSLSNRIAYPNSAKRTMPYLLGDPYSFEQKTQVVLPEEWPIMKTEFERKGNGFKFYNSITKSGNTINFYSSYSLTKSYIDGNAVASFLKDHTEINNNLSFILTDILRGSVGSKVSWELVLVTILIIILGVLLFGKLNTYLNPVPEFEGEALPIGGWLIISAISISISPFIYAYHAFTLEMFDIDTWLGIYHGGSENAVGILMLMAFEGIFNILMTLYMLYLMLMFYQKRSNVPMLVKLGYVLSLSFVVIDSFYGSYLMPESMEFLNKESIEIFFRTLSGFVIWGLYYHVSERVKQTFVRRA